MYASKLNRSEALVFMKCFNKKKFVGQEKSFIIEKCGFLINFFSACPCWAREGWGEGWREEEGGEVQREGGEEGGREGEGRWEEGGKGQRRKGEYFILVSNYSGGFFR